MKYVDRENWVEHYPENERDRKFLQSQYGATGAFECWCVAKKPEPQRVTLVPRRDPHRRAAQ